MFREAVDSASYGRQSTFLNDEVCDRLDAFAAFQIRKNEWPLAAHSERVRFHDTEIRPYKRSQVDLVDNEKVGARNSRSAFARDLFTFRNVDHIDRQIGQFGAESCRQIISARFDKAQFCVREISCSSLRWRRGSSKHLLELRCEGSLPFRLR